MRVAEPTNQPTPASMIEQSFSSLKITIATDESGRRNEARCASSVSFRLPRVRGARIVSVTVKRGSRVLSRRHGRNLRSLNLKRTSRKAYSVRINLKTSERRKQITLIRRISSC